LSNGSAKTHTVESQVPARLDQLPFSHWHWLVIAAFGIPWILDGLEVTMVGNIAAVLTDPKSGLGLSEGQVGLAGGIYIAGACSCGSKHAIQGFTESLRSELIHDRSNVKITMIQMPALNTPQFGWVKSRLPREPQPVPPIFQPEVAADAIVWAAHHDRDELWVGWPAVKAIVGNKVIPRVLDRYLARTGYDSQQTDDPVDPNRKDNVFEALDDTKDYSAHGSFDSRAQPKSYQL
jgi:hypothetical protein